jgi:hypothetical protein
MEICGREVWLLCSADLPDMVQGTQVLYFKFFRINSRDYGNISDETAIRLKGNIRLL